MKAIETKQITRSFQDHAVLKGLNIQVEEGEIYGFLGANGAGKTTTIRILLGLIKPDGGSAMILGHDLQTQADQIRAKSGALLEHHGLYERLSALDNLRYFAKIWHLPAQKTDERIKSLLGSLELWERRNELPGEWSHGMKKKLAVARALLHEPRLLFLDEPTSGMDVATSAALREQFQQLAKEEQVTIFLTTHNLYEAELICTQIGVLHQGIVVASGTADELRARNENHRYHVVSDPISDVVKEGLIQNQLVRTIQHENDHWVVELLPAVSAADVVGYLVTQGVKVEEIYKDKKSLEQAFLSLVEVEK
jgi:ABC-2 type transport system ATP-binding protein